MAAIKLQVAMAGRVARVTLNRPEARNAIDRALIRELGDMIRGVLLSESVRVVLLDGVGEVFCSGADLAAAVKSDSVSRYLGTLSRELNSILSYLTTVPAVVVTFASGKTIAGGVSLALAGDIRWAAPGTTFRCHSGRAGLTVEGGLSWRLPRIVGMSAAQKMIFEDHEVSAEEAKATGLVHEIIEPQAMSQAVGQIVERVKVLARGVFARNRQLLLGSGGRSFADSLAEEASMLKACAGSRDGDEGVRAAVEGRPSDFAS